MRKPRVTIAGSMYVMAVVAFNCALLRQFTVNYGEVLIVTGILLMTNLLIASFRRTLSSGETPKPFMIGFVVTGLFVMVAFAVCCKLFEDEITSHLRQFSMQVVLYLRRHAPSSMLEDMRNDVRYPVFLINLVVFATFSIITSIPQLLTALAGGVLFQRLSRRLPHESNA